MQYTNYGNIGLVLAVWLASDSYDLAYDPRVISATSLMKPTRSLILSRRVAENEKAGSVDIADVIQSRLGTAVHDAVEQAWLYRRDQGMMNLNIPGHIIEKIKLNPEEPSEDPEFDVYVEIRTEKQFGDWWISGKFDMVSNGRVIDVKTTSTYNWIKGSNDTNYMLQGSIYRWLNPEIITDDHMDVAMLFTDWSVMKAKADKKYPQKRCMTRTVKLLSIQETENWIQTQLNRITSNLDAPQSKLPRCTPEELWMDPTVWAYYKDKTKLTRSSKNCSTAGEAYAMLSKNPAGTVVERVSEPKFCRYCAARPICLQAEEYVNAGILKL